MEKISVKNFSVLQDIELEINKFIILIGEQASGKSLISKLVYFFKRMVLEDFYVSLFDSKSFNDFLEKLKHSFIDIFPGYFWQNDNIKIRYQYPSKDVKIDISSDGKLLYIAFSDNVKEAFNKLSKKLKEKKKDYLIADLLQDELQHIFFSEKSNVFFFPATRSFFSIIQKNVFKLDLSDTGDEYFIKRFGIIQEYLKNESKKTSEPLNNLFKSILKAEYFYDGSEEWLVNNGKKIKLKDSSTGQQELVYLVLFLTSLDTGKSQSDYFIIEEPDAHIFPSTQKQLVDLFATVYNTTNESCRFFITTHSPYILTCFNNLLQGHNTLEVLNNKKTSKNITIEQYNKSISKLNSIVPDEKKIKFDDLSVYIVKDGKLKDIKDYENMLLDADPIDDVSEIISEEFDNLLDIKYGE